ncbi:Multidrug resistance protein MdtN [Rosistilla carotiformis]|uniref:Multidrug resistance protein MdtN n=1 Tax=Rosistilla carotiformis TaxID=2528017 RepID=A0A518JZV7_9BACT|nr:HlyD family efflux transporter periplasmic adaptor subunit [Rosistilla carotiformis]QDV71072.1 Multidrug resistance protein MdtN [Rosistilla carotiformis]
MKRLYSKFHKLFSSVVLPTATLLGCIFVFRSLGVTTPPERPDPSNSILAQMQRLAPAEVMPVLSLDAVGGVVDLAVDGEVVPYREIQVATEVAGTIIYKSPKVEAGNYVQKGDVLFRIDPTDYELELQRLQQEKKSEYESLREIDQEISNVEKLIQVAKDDERLRDQEIARLDRLPAGFASQTELDQAKQSRLQSLNTRIGFENQLALLKKRRVRQETAEQRVETQMELARKNLERTSIEAPIDGVIYREDVEVNSFIQRGAVIVTLEDTSKAEVAANLRMDQLYWVLDQAHQHDASASMDSRSYSLPPTPATIEYRINQRDSVYSWKGALERYDGIGVDSQSRMVPVRLVVESPADVAGDGDGLSQRMQGPKALVRGMFVRVILHVTPQSSLSLVPNLALQPGNRIWKFQPDAAVLSVGPEGDSKAAASAAPSADPAISESTFDLKQWTAGRLMVLDRITPIVAVSLPGHDKETETEKYWICESRNGDLEAGNLVVVSPLGGVAGDGTDLIRVPAPKMSGGDVARVVETKAADRAVAQ